MNLIFMGTPDFAVGTLEALIDAGHLDGISSSNEINAFSLAEIEPSWYSL